MNDEQLSDWSEPGERPPRVGVWKTDRGQMGVSYQYFDGRVFRRAGTTPLQAFELRFYKSACDQSKVRFRGLVKKP